MISCVIVSLVVDVSENDFADRFLLVKEAFVLSLELCRCFRSFCMLLFPRATHDSFLFRFFFDSADKFAVRPCQIKWVATRPADVTLLVFVKAEAILCLSMWCVTMCWSYIDPEICTPRERRYIKRRVNTPQSSPFCWLGKWPILFCVS